MGKGHRFSYNWTLKDANFTKDKGKVFSCFACGGGSTMGYKLAGFDVIGCNEIDPKMNECYVRNNNPKYNYVCDIRDMVKSNELPEELYNLDILDGSPPCSTFSISGSREDSWGVEKKFREGQKKQVLDTLFFDFIDLAKKLKPKIVVSENVKGLLMGNAKNYVKKIYHEFDLAGYYCQHFLLNASDMGVPQNRERLFFLCIRKDIGNKFLHKKNLFDLVPFIDMNFKEEPILFKEIVDYGGKEIKKGSKTRFLWDNQKIEDKSLCDVYQRLYNKRGFYNFNFFDERSVAPTLIPAKHMTLILKTKPMYLSRNEIIKISSFPLDYKGNDKEIGYLCGMSVPPVMMANVANNIYEQWLSKL